MLRTRRVPALVAVLALTLTPLAACGKSAEERAVEALVKNSDESIKGVDIDGDSFTMKTDDGELSMGEKTTVPDAFPSDVPLPEADYTVTMSTVSGDSVTLMLAIPALDVTAETARTVAALESAGWGEVDKSEINSGTSQMTILGATKGDQRLSLTLTRDGDDDGAAMYTVAER